MSDPKAEDLGDSPDGKSSTLDSVTEQKIKSEAEAHPPTRGTISKYFEGKKEEAPKEDYEARESTEPRKMEEDEAVASVDTDNVTKQDTLSARAPLRRSKRKTEKRHKSPGLSNELEENTEANLQPPPKKKRLKRGYAPPEVYAHLNLVQDCLDYELDILFCGINPGQKSAGEGHHFANPRNGFWKCLHQGGLTNALIPPAQDYTLPGRFRLGITNLVDRPSAEMGELSLEERRAGVAPFLRKVHKWRPRIVCMVGKGIWEDVFNYVVKSARGKGPKDGILVHELAESGTARGKLKENFEYDLQPVCLLHEDSKGVERTLFFVVPSTSGRVLTHQLADKVELFKLLNKRRSELGGGTDKRVMRWEVRVAHGTWGDVVG